MITRKEVLMGRDLSYPLTPDLEQNLVRLLAALNRLRTIYGKSMTVSSGYRPGHFNKTAGGAHTSAHLTCEACDFRDPEGKLAAWLLSHNKVLINCGLFLESPTHTPGWVHLQTRPTINRIFLP